MMEMDNEKYKVENKKIKNMENNPTKCKCLWLVFNTWSIISPGANLCGFFYQ